MKIKAGIRGPDPRVGTVDVADYVLADIQSRVDAGYEKYGTKLQANNGRDALMDAYQSNRPSDVPAASYT